MTYGQQHHENQIGYKMNKPFNVVEPRKWINVSGKYILTGGFMFMEDGKQKQASAVFDKENRKMDSYIINSFKQIELLHGIDMPVKA